MLVITIILKAKYILQPLFYLILIQSESQNMNPLSNNNTTPNGLPTPNPPHQNSPTPAVDLHKPRWLYFRQLPDNRVMAVIRSPDDAERMAKYLPDGRLKPFMNRGKGDFKFSFDPDKKELSVLCPRSKFTKQKLISTFAADILNVWQSTGYQVEKLDPNKNSYKNIEILGFDPISIDFSIIFPEWNNIKVYFRYSELQFSMGLPYLQRIDRATEPRLAFALTRDQNQFIKSPRLSFLDQFSLVNKFQVILEKLRQTFTVGMTLHNMHHGTRITQKIDNQKEHGIVFNKQRQRFYSKVCEHSLLSYNCRHNKYKISLEYDMQLYGSDHPNLVLNVLVLLESLIKDQKDAIVTLPGLQRETSKQGGKEKTKDKDKDTASKENSVKDAASTIVKDTPRVRIIIKLLDSKSERHDLLAKFIDKYKNMHTMLTEAMISPSTSVLHQPSTPNAPRLEFVYKDRVKLEEIMYDLENFCFMQLDTQPKTMRIQQQQRQIFIDRGEREEVLEMFEGKRKFQLNVDPSNYSISLRNILVEQALQPRADQFKKIFGSYLNGVFQVFPLGMQQIMKPLDLLANYLNITHKDLDAVLEKILRQVKQTVINGGRYWKINLKNQRSTDFTVSFTLYTIQTRMTKCPYSVRVSVNGQDVIVQNSKGLRKSYHLKNFVSQWKLGG